jgi:hypothetical protein
MKSRTNVLNIRNTPAGVFHGRGDFDRGRILASSSSGGFVGFGYGSGSIPHEPVSSSVDRRRALASAHFQDIQEKRKDAISRSQGSGPGPGPGPGLRERPDLGPGPSLKDVDDALKAEERRLRKKRHQKMMIKGGMKDGRTRVVISSSARARPSTTTSSDFVVNIPSDILQTPVYGIEVVGWSFPLSKWTVEPFENHVPFRMGRHFEPGCRSISTIFATSAKVTTEMPVTWNPITFVGPVERAGVRGVRFRCLYRVGTCMSEYASHHESNFPTGVPGLRIISMPFGEDPHTLDDTMRLDPSRIVGPRYAGADLDAEPPLRCASRGSNVLNDLHAHHVGESGLLYAAPSDPTDPREFFYMDEGLYGRMFSRDERPLGYEDRRGVPYGWLAAAVPSTRQECVSAIARCMSSDLHHLGVRVSPPVRPSSSFGTSPEPDGGGPTLFTMTFVRRRSEDEDGDLPHLHTDNLGPVHLGLDVRNSPNGSFDEVAASSISWGRRLRNAIPEAEAVAFEPGPMRSGVRDVAAALQRAADSTWYHPMGNQAAPTFALPVCVETHTAAALSSSSPGGVVVTVVAVPSGMYSPRDAAFAIQAALRGAFPGVGFEVAERPMGFAFRASVVFSLRFDLASTQTEVSQTLVDPDKLGYSPKNYSGSMWYEPGERTFRSRPPASPRVAPAGFGREAPAAWPFRLKTACDSECKMIVMNAEPLPRVSGATILRAWPEAHLVLLRTSAAMRLPEGTRIRVVPRVPPEGAAADDVAYGTAQQQLAVLRAQLQVLVSESGVHSAASLLELVGAFAEALPGSLLDMPPDHAVHEMYAEVSARAEAISSDLDGYPQGDAGAEAVRATWEPVIVASVALLRRAILRARTIDISVWGRALHTSSRNVSDFDLDTEIEGGALIPYGLPPSEIDLENPDEEPDQTRVLLLSLSQPSILFSHPASASQEAGEEDTGLVDDLSTILAMSESFALHPMNSDICPLVMDLSSWCESMVRPEVIGFGPSEYTIYRPGEHPYLLESDRDVDMSQQQYILVNIDANVSETDITRVTRFEDRRFEGRPQSLNMSTGDSGSLFVMSATSEPGDPDRSLISATRCTAYLPLGEAHISTFDARAARWFDSPIKLSNVRITIMLPDGRLYPFHGRDVSIALRFVSVSQGVPDESEPDED